jgi:hypothetical protein
MVSKVHAHAPCSVVVVPREAAPWRRGVLVAVDPDRSAAAQATLVAQAFAMARVAGSPAHLLCVAARAGERDAADERLRELSAGLDPAPASAEVRTGAAHTEIIAAAQARGVDLVALARPRASALGRAWGSGGVAPKVIGLATCAVLVHVSREGAP